MWQVMPIVFKYSEMKWMKILWKKDDNRNYTSSESYIIITYMIYTLTVPLAYIKFKVKFVQMTFKIALHSTYVL